MSTEYNIPLEIILGVIVSIISYIVGLMTRKFVWRRVIKGIKWLLNDIITVDLLAVREYPHIELKEMDLSLFDDLKEKIHDIKLVQRHPEGMIVYIPPLFGNMIIEINEQFPPPSDTLEHEGTTK